MSRRFLDALGERPLVFDGATGTMLQRLGLEPGGCPDELNISRAEMVAEVHRAYIEAGSDVVTTNTFGATRVKLREYGLESRLAEINGAAARNARRAAGARRFVAGCMGPTGRFVEPVGDMEFDEAVDIFTEQARALKDGGVDLFIIETMMDIKELKAAVMAARSTGLPVAATMTFDESMRSVLGTPPEAFAAVASSLGAALIGANCSLGADGILRAVRAMADVTDTPLIAQPNAGIPVLKGGETVFPATPEEMAEYAPRFAAAGVRVLGGCCGTTPEHIRAMGSAFRALETYRPARRPFTVLASRTGAVTLGGGGRPVVIGERINPTGKKAFSEEIKAGGTALLRKTAREQEGSGADILDVNVGVPDIDEAAAMRRAVFAVNDNCALPVVIDTSDMAAMEAGLRAVDGKPLINSVSGEAKKLDAVIPLARRYGGALLGLTLDDDGIPESAAGRLRVAEKILERAEAAGLAREDLVIDPLALTVSADPKSAVTTVEAIRLIKEELGLNTVLGVSNISFGLPSRPVVNAAFLTMALAAGLDAAIMNPNNQAMMDAFAASLLLLGHDERAERYIRRFSGAAAPAAGGGAKAAAKDLPPRGLKERISRAVVEGDEEAITGLVEEALAEGWDPLRISNEALIPGLEEVGRLFASNRYFLPQVILSADTMKRAFERLKKEIAGRKGPSIGRVVMATVEGDIHDIGKNIVTTLLENHGFEVYDLGKNVPADRIVEEARRRDVHIVGLSALMTTTVMEMDNVLRRLREAGVKAKTIVGGAVVTAEFAERIGADEYGGDALSAVEKMKRLVAEAEAAG
ncbi:MAG TPA: 5-methyltetrahydrofolate--homocysteine methyltransferase [Deltaproteobacteria bacterium]|nr:5-methyltetrahydrofolate--homocysteine methyltransferase [Deltaproteobacteria bacterium]